MTGRQDSKYDTRKNIRTAFAEKKWRDTFIKKHNWNFRLRFHVMVISSGLHKTMLLFLENLEEGSTSIIYLLWWIFCRISFHEIYACLIYACLRSRRISLAFLFRMTL
jgi:hypothetical protein